MTNKTLTTLTLLIPLLLLTTTTPETTLQAQGYTYNPNRNGGKRYCYNPKCQMCNQIWGPMNGYDMNGNKIQQPQPPTTQYQPQYQPLPLTPQQPLPLPQPTYQPLPLTPTPQYQPLPTPLPQTNNQPPDTELHPTDQQTVEQLLQLLNPQPGQWIYDLGAGDARILTTATKHYKTKGTGIEINPNSVKIAQQNINNAQQQNQNKIIQGNILDQNNINNTTKNADYITLYLYPELLQQVTQKIKQTHTKNPRPITIISINHDIPQQQTNKRILPNNTPIYIWELK